MNLGNSLFQSRKKSGFSQEEVAEKLGVSRQTISKWELNETVPDIYQARKMANLYTIPLDDLLDFDADLKEIEQVIMDSDEKKDAKIDWTSAWSKKYPILATYQNQVHIEDYAARLQEMIAQLQRDYKLNHSDAFLVLKDILAQVWKQSEK